MTRRIGIRGAACALAAASVLSAALVRAQQEEPRLLVERESGTEDCPDGVELDGRLENLRGKPHTGTSRYRVRFARRDTGFGVTIRVEPGDRVRTLDSQDTTCAALARATAVTLAVLVDAERDETPVPPKAEPPAPATPPAIPASQPGRAGGTRLDTTLAVGLAGATGVIGPASLGVTGEVGLIAGRFRAAIGGLFLFPETLSLAPGSVEQRLSSGLARLCYAPLLADRVRLDACSGLVVGVEHAHARGYTRNDDRNTSWLAVPLGASATLFTGRLGWELGAGALFSLHRNDYGIDGLGVAYRSPAVSGLLTLRVVILGPGWTL
jgi:hypothetical protein